jgi:cysteine-rich repeat protein
MRRPILAAILGFGLPACMIGDGSISGGGGSGGGGDDNPGAVCGNNTLETGEQCDDGNTNAGDGCSSSCQTEAPAPRLTATLDQPTVTTELGKTETVNLTLTSENAFTGTVNIATSFVDATDAPVTGVTVTAAPTADVAADGTQMVPITIKVAPNATGAVLNATLHVDLTSSADSPMLTSAVTINNIYTVDYAAGTGTTSANHAQAGVDIKVKRGALLHFKNDDTTRHIIHAGGSYSNAHENTNTGGAPGRTYEINTIQFAAGSVGDIGCHDHGGTATYFNVQLQ